MSKTISMLENYSEKNLHKTSFKNGDLRHANFAGSDLRGADFTGADLSGANLSRCKTGIIPSKVIMIFFAAIVVSALSGFVAMLAGQAVQVMLSSEDANVRFAGITTVVITIVFIIYAYLRGVAAAIKYIMLPPAIAAVVIGLVTYHFGAGTGKGAIYLLLAFALEIGMFFIGTIARSVAGMLSGVLFVITALSGGIFGKSLGGGAGAAIMAISCALISKRALSGARGFDRLHHIATSITARFGTSFRGARLTGTNFSGATIRNSDFSGADISSVRWQNVIKKNCIPTELNTKPEKKIPNHGHQYGLKQP